MLYIIMLRQVSKSAILFLLESGLLGPGGLLLGAAVITVVVGMFVILVQQSVLSVVDSVL